MTKLQHVDAVLARMIELLQTGGYGDWAVTLERYRASLASDVAGTGSQLRRLYGGMGSLSDIVLYKNDLLLHQENDEFDNLRSRLYQLLR